MKAAAKVKPEAKVKYDKCKICKHDLPPCPVGHEAHYLEIGCGCEVCIARVLA